MKKLIIIDESDNNKEKNHFKRLINNKIFEWLLYMVGYAIVLIAVSCMFKDSFYINNQYYGLYALLAAVIIYILNQTIKPVLFYLTLPITALSMGLFYPIINVLVLYITSFILGDNFQIQGFIIPFVIAVVISVLNMLMEGMIIKPIIYKGKE
ncbi:MAG: phage holin family protein [Bacilli bacterium]|nr:phage holin family protein [Bacilli bacterium]